MQKGDAISKFCILGSSTIWSFKDFGCHFAAIFMAAIVKFTVPNWDSVMCCMATLIEKYRKYTIFFTLLIILVSILKNGGHFQHVFVVTLVSISRKGNHF